MMALSQKMSLCLAALVSQVACTGLGVDAESDALCGAQLGNPCTTIQDADGQGGVSRTLAETKRDTQAEQLSQNILMAGKSTTPALTAPDGGAPYYVQAYRHPERLATAWIAPRLDSNGIFHEATFIHFVVRQAAWGRGGVKS